jgi:hypothetical protein
MSYEKRSGRAGRSVKEVWGIEVGRMSYREIKLVFCTQDSSTYPLSTASIKTLANLNSHSRYCSIAIEHTINFLSSGNPDILSLEKLRRVRHEAHLSWSPLRPYTLMNPSIDYDTSIFRYHPPSES